MSDRLSIGLVQIAPVWLNREKTVQKVVEYLEDAAKQGVDLAIFGEALVPGYPFWLDKLSGSAFDSPMHKEIHSKYLKEAVQIESGHLDSICETAKSKNIACYLGIVERPADRGGHSLYCSLLYIDKQGKILSVHRKLTPTHEERLAWAPGDGHGLQTHSLGAFTIGGLNCWENWLPLARTALYAQGEDFHVSVWPGNKRNTEKLLPVIAQEARAYVAGVSGVFRPEDIPDGFPFADQMRAATSETLADGGSCLVAPDGAWVVPPVTNREELIIAEIDHSSVRKERQNFDSSGHYARPDVLKLQLDRNRQSILE